MTPHQTLAVAVRLFAILLALFSARELLWFYLDGRERIDAYVTPIAILGVATATALFALLWIFPKRIADGLLPLSEDMPAPPSAPDAWLAVGSSLIGLWLAASAVPALIRNLAVMYLVRAEPLDKSGVMSGLFYYVLQFAVGVLLILGANQIRNFILWVRTAGIGKPINSSAESEPRTKEH